MKRKLSRCIDKFDGRYKFLSNFYPCIINYKDIVYDSAEAAYQAQKTKDKSLRKTFSGVGPSAAKKMGYRMKLREDWEDIKIGVMTKIIKSKFKQNKALSELLVDTFPQKLIEGNYWKDIYWGQYGEIGENHLGKILMKVRKKIIRGIR